MRPGALHAPLGPGGQLGHDLGTAAAVATEGSARQHPQGPARQHPPGPRTGRLGPAQAASVITFPWGLW